MRSILIALVLIPASAYAKELTLDITAEKVHDKHATAERKLTHRCSVHYFGTSLTNFQWSKHHLAKGTCHVPCANASKLCSQPEALLAQWCREKVKLDCK